MLRTTTPRAREIPDTPTGKVGYARDPDKGLEYLRRLEEAPLAMSAARSGDERGLGVLDPCLADLRGCGFR